MISVCGSLFGLRKKWKAETCVMVEPYIPVVVDGRRDVKRRFRAKGSVAPSAPRGTRKNNYKIQQPNKA